MSFAQSDPSVSSNLETMLGHLCEILEDYYYTQDRKEIYLIETKIIEYIQEYLPFLESDLHNLFSYIHETMDKNEYFEESEIEALISQIYSHINRTKEISSTHLRYSDEISKQYSIEKEYYREYVKAYKKTTGEILTSFIQEEQLPSGEEDNTRLTPAEKKVIALERKKQLINEVLSLLAKEDFPVTFSYIKNQNKHITRQILEIVRKDPAVVDYHDRLRAASKLRLVIDFKESAMLLNAIQNTFVIETRHSSSEIYKQLQAKSEIKAILDLLSMAGIANMRLSAVQSRYWVLT